MQTTTIEPSSKANLRAVGGSVMLAIPPALLDVLGLKPNTQVALSIDQGRLVVQPAAKPRYTLDELIAQCRPELPMTEEELEWLNDPPSGLEVI